MRYHLSQIRAAASETALLRFSYITYIFDQQVSLAFPLPPYNRMLWVLFRSFNALVADFSKSQASLMFLKFRYHFNS